MVLSYFIFRFNSWDSFDLFSRPFEYTGAQRLVLYKYAVSNPEKKICCIVSKSLFVYQDGNQYYYQLYLVEH